VGAGVLARERAAREAEAPAGLVLEVGAVARLGGLAPIVAADRSTGARPGAFPLSLAFALSFAFAFAFPFALARRAAGVAQRRERAAVLPAGVRRRADVLGAAVAPGREQQEHERGERGEGERPGSHGRPHESGHVGHPRTCFGSRGPIVVRSALRRA